MRSNYYTKEVCLSLAQLRQEEALIALVAIPRLRWNNWNNWKPMDVRSLNGDCGGVSRSVPVLISAPTGSRDAQQLFVFLPWKPSLT